MPSICHYTRFLKYQEERRNLIDEYEDKISKLSAKQLAIPAKTETMKSSEVADDPHPTTEWEEERQSLKLQLRQIEEVRGSKWFIAAKKLGQLYN